ncbi:MAG: DUF4870 domain-containing protein [Leifsonia sp.]
MSDQAPPPPQSPDDGSLPPSQHQPPQQPPIPPQYAAPQQNPYASNEPAAPLTDAEDRQWASWAHFGGAIAVLAVFNPWLAILAIVPALVILIVFGKRGALTRSQAVEALNFQITMVGAMVLVAIVSSLVFSSLMWTVGFGPWAVAGLFFSLLGWALVIVDVVFSILAGLRVNNGGAYRYPFAMRVVK